MSNVENNGISRAVIKNRVPVLGKHVEEGRNFFKG